MTGHATPQSVQPPLCRYCDQPIPQVAANTADERWYHGDCYRERDKLEPGPIALQSHDDLVQDGLEYP